MKNLYKILLSFLLIIPFVSHGQLYTGSMAKSFNEKSKSIYIDNDEVKYIKFDTPLSTSSYDILIQEVVKSTNNTTYQLISTQKDNIGQVHYRYQQMYMGYIVDGYQYIVHTDIEGKVISINGDYKRINNLSNSLSITNKDAIEIGKSYIKSDKYIDETEEPIKIVYDSKISWKVDIYSLNPHSRYYLIIDAENGEILSKINRIHHTDVNGVAHTKYRGVQNIITDSISPTNYVLRDNGRSVYTRDMNNYSFGNYSFATDFTDSNNIWDDTTNNASLDVHFGTEKTYDYFYNIYGLDSYDGNGATINSYAHFGTNYNNAFWDGSRLGYGDGSLPNWTSFTSIDIVAHEITHAVTQYSSNLVYAYEPGAINESFSDIFGVTIEHYVDSTNYNWYIGDEFNLTGNGFRSMSNPNEFNDPDTYLGNYWYIGTSDNGGVHTNSGVGNYWYYLIVVGGSGTNDNGDLYNVSGIGFDDASDIAYRTLSVYLTPISQYSDARLYSIISSVDLFGGCSDQEKSVTNAWYAVGVGTPYSDYVISDFTESSTYSCSVPKTIQFFNLSSNDTASLWDFGDGNTSTLNSPSHTYTSVGDYTVTLTSYSGSVCGNVSSQLTKPNLITIDSVSPVSPYCTPIQLSNSNPNFGVFNFQFGDINNSTPISSPYRQTYVDYSCDVSTYNNIGDTIEMRVNTGSIIAHCEVYIDWDNDGIFDSTELVLYKLSAIGNSTNPHTSQVVVPTNVVLNKPLRIRVHGQSAVLNMGQCGGYSHRYESYEDYSIIVEFSCLDYITKSSGNWNDTSVWCNNIIPDITSDVTITSGDSVFVINGSCNSLNIGNNSIVHIDTNGYLTVNNNIINNGVMNIMDDASLIQNVSSSINSGNGEYNLYRIGNSSTLSYNIWSSPMTSTHIPTVFNNTNQWDIFYFDGIIQNWAYDYTGYGGDDYMDIGRGYFIPGDGTSNPKHFNGQVNNGTLYFDIYTTTLGDKPYWDDDDWNLIGNPYPSAISVYDLYTDNINVLSDGIYWWDNGTPPYDQWGDYAVMNLTGSVSSNNSNILPNGFISSAQGVFVVADTTMGSINTLQLEFNNSMRDSTLNNQFYSTSTINNKAWIMLEDGTFNSSILIGIVGDSKDGYDTKYDAHSISGTHRVNMTSLLNNEEFIIQGIGEINYGDSKRIPLKVDVYRNNFYTFRLSNIENFTDYEIYLEDSYNNKYIDLKKSNYTTTINPKYDDIRFYIEFRRVISDTTTTNTNNLEMVDLEYNFAQREDILSINSNKKGNIFIYDIMGKEIYNNYIINSHQIDISKYSSGTYILKFIGDSDLRSDKIIIIR